MKNLLIAVALSALVCGACTGSKARLASSDPANNPAVVTHDIDNFNAQKATFNLRIKNFNIAGGEWVKGSDMGIVELERAGIAQMQQYGYAYMPDPEQSRYTVEFHLTCYDPAGGSETSLIPEDGMALPGGFAWAPYAADEKTYVFTMHSGKAPAGPKSCAGRMLLLIRDREGGGQGTVYAGHHSLAPCPYEQGCVFAACQEQHKDEVLNYLDIVFPE